MQLSSISSSASAPRFDGPAFRLGWDFDKGGDDDGRSNEFTYSPTGAATELGWRHTAATAAALGMEHARQHGGMWAVYDALDGPAYVVRLQRTDRLGQGPSDRDTVENLLRSEASDQWKATRLADDLVAVLDATTAADAANWTQLDV